MLTLFLLYSLILLISKSRLITFPIVLFFIFVYYLSKLNPFFLSTLTVNNQFIINDEMSIFMTILLFFIMFISYLCARRFKSYKSLGLVFIILFFFCFQVFNTCHLFSLYFFYEASLIPIFYIIIKWGSYPERSVRAMMMLSYTLIFGVPIFIIIIYRYRSRLTWYIPFFLWGNSTPLVSLLIFLCFAVKLPVYGLHYWLPMAHVEAPTFGSVILARILLKLGGVGLYRMIPLIDLSYLTNILLSYLILFTLFSTIVCCFQSDFKRLIAYSSVAHMIVVPFLIIRNNLLSVQSLIIVILFHGLSSTLIFIRVGVLYSIFSSRQLILMRGLILTSPLLRILIVLTFFFTLSAPPFPSFIAEIYFMMSTYILTEYIVFLFIPFVLLCLVYNLNWLSRILFSSSTDTNFSNSHFSYNTLLPFFLVIIFTIFIIPLFIFF